MHRQQLHRGHAEVRQVVDDRRRGESGVRPAQLLGHAVVQRGHPLDVHLVDHRVAVAAAQRRVVAPVELLAQHHAPGDVRRGVGVVALLRGVGLVAEDRRVDGDLARHRARIGVEQQLGGVEPQPAIGLPRAVHPEAVAGAGGDAGQRAVPDAAGQLGQLVRRLAVLVVEEADPGRGGVGSVHGEVRRLLRPRGPEGMVAPRPDLGGLALVVPHARCHGRHCCRWHAYCERSWPISDLGGVVNACPCSA